jgi:hypothetical protein
MSEIQGLQPLSRRSLNGHKPPFGASAYYLLHSSLQPSESFATGICGSIAGEQCFALVFRGSITYTEPRNGVSRAMRKMLRTITAMSSAS